MLVSAELNFHGRRFFICSDRTASRSSGGPLRKPLVLPTLRAPLFHFRSVELARPHGGHRLNEPKEKARDRAWNKKAAVAGITSPRVRMENK